MHHSETCSSKDASTSRPLAARFPSFSSHLRATLYQRPSCELRGSGVLPWVLLAATLLFGSPAAFSVTKEQYELWPSYCKARFPESAMGQASAWLTPVSQAEIRRWRQQIGPGPWRYLHHYCFGLAELQTARFLPEGPERTNRVDAAFREIQAFLNNGGTPTSHWLWGQATTDLALGYELRGDRAAAIQHANAAIQAQPSYPSAYTLLAMMLSRSGEREEAVKVLKRGEVATKGKSAEIQYNLGLYMLDLGDVEAARQYAEAAYRLGYPLQGLKKRLAERSAPQE